MVYLTARRAGRRRVAGRRLRRGEPAPWIDPGDDGTIGVHADVVREVFLWDVDDRHGRRGRRPADPPAPGACSRTRSAVCAWREKPSTYLVCTRDRAIPAERAARLAARTRRVAELPTGHFPFLTAPGPAGRRP